jgi:acetyl-CoA synthetase
LGRALPGCTLTVLDGNFQEADEGELTLPMTPRPPGLMIGYLQEDGSLRPITGEYCRSGDAVSRTPDGVFTYIGRVGDVFKSSDYRISAFELECADRATLRSSRPR